MSDFSLILVLQIKTSKNHQWRGKDTNKIWEIQIKSEKITPFGGIFPIMDEFNRVLSGIVDSTLGFRCKLFGYQYSEIIRSIMCVYFCGSTCIEDHKRDNRPFWPLRKILPLKTIHTRHCRGLPADFQRIICYGLGGVMNPALVTGWRCCSASSFTELKR